MNKSSNLKFPIIDGIIVDIMSIISIKYSCDPKLCAGKKSCCASYDICIEKKDVSKIIPYFSEAAKFAPHIKKGDEYDNMFDETDDGLISLETDENWQCKLAWKNDAGDVLCSLHSHALKNNLSFYDTKPKICCLWPLAESETKQQSLTIDSDCLTFPCVKEKTVHDFKINNEIVSIIKNIYGLDFLEKIEAAIEKMKNEK